MLLRTGGFVTSLAMEGHLHLKKRKRLHNFELQLFRVLKTQNLSSDWLVHSVKFKISHCVEDQL